MFVEYRHKSPRIAKVCSQKQVVGDWVQGRVAVIDVARLVVFALPAVAAGEDASFFQGA